MELKKGYRHTEVGVIPEDWEVDVLGNITTVVTNGFVGKATLFYTDEGVIYIQGYNIEEMGFNFNGIKQVTKEFHKQHSKSSLLEGDLLTIQTGEIGVTAVVTKELEGSNCHALIISRLIKNKYVPKYFGYYFNSFNGKRRMKDIETGSTMKHLNVGDMLKWAVPFPPTKTEQEAIAQALNNADELITALEKLIAKKRDIKQGAMQQLLTGKKRLPGFNGKWEVKVLDELFTFSGGYAASREELSVNGFCYLHYGDIHKSSKTYIDVSAKYAEIPKLNIPINYVSRSSLLNDGDVVFVDASEDDEGASKHIVVQNPQNIDYISGLHTIVLKSKDESLDNAYKQYCFQTRDVKKQFLFYAVGTKVTGISKTNIAKIHIPIPHKSEQTAIAQVLSDMDAEITAFETKLEKYKMIKQGMMQELLTGRIRLIQQKEVGAPMTVAIKASEATGALPKSGHNWQINEAVVISVLASVFGSEKFPLGRKRYTKFSYLLHRYVEGKVEGYRKKAAGPYNPDTKYKGPEKIAQNNRYIKPHTRGEFSGFIVDENIEQAKKYFEKWYGCEVLPWLEQFRYENNEKLELLTTVDMAVCNLMETEQTVSFAGVKGVIRSHSEWKAKLNRPIFSDKNITAAIKKSQELFWV